ncbi:MAG: hypothetical protein COA78_01310 [Blastopirellula sp.]|nr:MAG: hypothetical protein COA78_01310 [Blastopirellula sp.]
MNNNKIPVRLVFSVMIGTVALLLGIFLRIVATKFNFEWPGTFKTVVCGLLLLACVVYGTMRGRNDVEIARSLSRDQSQVGFIHFAVIMGMIFVITGFAIYILIGYPYINPPF